MPRCGSGDGYARRPPRLDNNEWLNRPATRVVFACLLAAGYEACAVGGAVRNALLGHPVKDVDIATTATPEDVIRCAETAGLKAVPTGIGHGTVTVISGDEPFEVTTLRRDIETFGRRARVAFTDNWADDAKRRDFTINALYCDIEGQVFDPVGGYDDLINGRVRFIGNAHDRIKEDYLRILRFFRFTAEYAAGIIDVSGLNACRTLKAGLDQLPGERVRGELFQILLAKDTIPATEAMIATGCLAQLVGRRGDATPLGVLIAIERQLGLSPDPLLRLAALVIAEPGDAVALRNRLKLSSIDFDRLARMVIPDRAFDPATPEQEARALIYRFGAQAFLDGTLLAWAHSAHASNDEARIDRYTLAQRWQAPKLPFSGSDILARGVTPGPRVGIILTALEDWWIAEGFPDDPSRLSVKLNELAKVTKP